MPPTQCCPTRADYDTGRTSQEAWKQKQRQRQEEEMDREKRESEEKITTADGYKKIDDRTVKRAQLDKVLSVSILGIWLVGLIAAFYWDRLLCYYLLGYIIVIAVIVVISTGAIAVVAKLCSMQIKHFSLPLVTVLAVLFVIFMLWQSSGVKPDGGAIVYSIQYLLQKPNLLLTILCPIGTILFVAVSSTKFGWKRSGRLLILSIAVVLPFFIFGGGQNKLGSYYKKGWLGVAQDYGKAVLWYQKAADLGDAAAQNNLGLMYLNGLGANQDYSKALELFQKAIDQNGGAASVAQWNLGLMYFEGRGVQKNYSKAMELFEKSANQGFVKAQNLLMEMYSKGIGVARDYDKAKYWYQKAAQQRAKEIQTGLKHK
jgi:hypothetical protein